MASFDFKGKEYRVYKSGIWKLYSFLTHASDVVFDDNKTVEEKISEINTSIQNIKTSKPDKSDVVNDLNTAIAVTNTQTPIGCGVAKELNQKTLHIVSFDASSGTLITKSYDYTG